MNLRRSSTTLATIACIALMSGVDASPPDGAPQSDAGPWFSRFHASGEAHRQSSIRSGARSDLFRDASLSPDNVAIYIHISDPAGLRAALDDRPAGEWLKAKLHKGRLPEVWSGLADAVSMREDVLFDRVFNAPCTLLVRSQANDEANGDDKRRCRRQREWVLITRMDDRTLKPLLQQLKPRMHLPRCGMAIEEFPEHELMIAHDPQHRVIIGPSDRRALFNDVVERVKGHEADDSLADRPFVHAAGTLGGGQIAIYMRHRQRIGGWSAFVGDLRGDVLHVRQVARFDVAPFDSKVVGRPIDVSPLLALEDDSILAMIQPTDAGAGPVESFLKCATGESFLGEALRDYVGARRITIFSEQNVPIDRRTAGRAGPTAVMACVELDSDAHVRDALDKRMSNFETHLQALAQKRHDDQATASSDGERNPPGQSSPQTQSNGDFGTRMARMITPDDAGYRASKTARQIPLTEAEQSLFSRVPTLGEVSLNWDIVESPQSRWGLVASCPRQLNSIRAALNGGPQTQRHNAVLQSLDDPSRRRVVLNHVSSCGTLDGQHLSRALRGWLAQRAAQDGDGRRCRTNECWEHLAEIAETMTRLRWQLIRPEEKQMRLEIQIILADDSSQRK